MCQESSSNFEHVDADTYIMCIYHESQSIGKASGSNANEMSKGGVWRGGCERGNLGAADPEPGGGEQKKRWPGDSKNE